MLICFIKWHFYLLFKNLLVLLFLKLIGPTNPFVKWARLCCIVLLLTCLCPYLLMNASVEGHPDIFKFLSIMNRAVLHYLMLVLFHSFAKQFIHKYKEYLLLDPKVRLFKFVESAKLSSNVDCLCIHQHLECTLVYFFSL